MTAWGNQQSDIVVIENFFSCQKNEKIHCMTCFYNQFQILNNHTLSCISKILHKMVHFSLYLLSSPSSSSSFIRCYSNVLKSFRAKHLKGNIEVWPFLASGMFACHASKNAKYREFFSSSARFWIKKWSSSCRVTKTTLDTLNSPAWYEKFVLNLKYFLADFLNCFRNCTSNKNVNNYNSWLKIKTDIYAET